MKPALLLLLMIQVAQTLSHSLSTTVFGFSANNIMPKRNRQTGEHDDDDYCRQWYLRSFRGPPTEDRLLPALKTLKIQENVESALYPGSYIHKIPSLVFSRVVYVDCFKGKNNHVKQFFERLPESLLMPQTLENKSVVKFYQEDLTQWSPKKEEEDLVPFDLLLSLSAGGNISQSCAKFVRPGGLLFANDEFGDASLARSNPETWTFVGVLQQDESFIMGDANILECYFKSPKAIKLNLPLLEQCRANSGHGFSKRPYKYKKNAMAYVFRRV
jgi:hypothetical protein